LDYWSAKRSSFSRFASLADDLTAAYASHAFVMWNPYTWTTKPNGEVTRDQGIIENEQRVSEISPLTV
jgi:hypothetical protein